MSSIESPNSFLSVGFLSRLLATEYDLSKGSVHAVIHLILSVAMETVMLNQGFIHCHLIYLTCAYSVSQNRNELTPIYRCCGSLISEFIKF